jgi:hypothetical protein
MDFARVVDGDARPQRRRKTAKERREQAHRAEGRLIAKLLRAFNHLHHRGSQPTRLFSALCSSLGSRAAADTEARANDVPTHPEVFAVDTGDEAEYEDEFLPNTGESHVASPAASETGSWASAAHAVVVPVAMLASPLAQVVPPPPLPYATTNRDTVRLAAQPDFLSGDRGLSQSSAHIVASVPKAAQPDCLSGDLAANTFRTADAVAASAIGVEPRADDTEQSASWSHRSMESHLGFANLAASSLAPGGIAFSSEPPPCGACVVLISVGRSVQSCPICAGRRAPLPD